MFTRTRTRFFGSLAVLAAMTLGAAAVRAETPIDPKLYLPTLEDKESLVVASVNVPAILKLEPVKKLLEEKKAEDEMAKSPVNLKLADFSEVVVIAAGNLAAKPTPYVLVRTTKDMTIKEMAKDPAKLGEPKSIAGFDVYTVKAEGEDNKVHSFTRLAAATYLIAPEADDNKLTAYLRQIAKKKSGTYTDELTASAKEAGKGDIVILASIKNMGDEAPEAVAVSVSLGETMKAKAVLKMKNADTANELLEGLQKMKDNLPLKIPNLEFAAKESTVTAKASASMKEIEEMVEQIKTMIPMPF